jgi:uncharacterized membrane protein YbhN (UPF0104 family)
MRTIVSSLSIFDLGEVGSRIRMHAARYEGVRKNHPRCAKNISRLFYMEKSEMIIFIHRPAKILSCLLVSTFSWASQITRIYAIRSGVIRSLPHADFSTARFSLPDHKSGRCRATRGYARLTNSPNARHPT